MKNSSFRKAPRTSYRIGSLMLAVAIVAVVLAIVKLAPAVSAVLAFPSAVAMGISVLHVNERASSRPSLWDYVVAFVPALFFVCIVCLATIAAFFATCLSVATVASPWGNFMPLAILCAVAAGIATPVAMVMMARAMTRPSRIGKPSSSGKDELS